VALFRFYKTPVALRRRRRQAAVLGFRLFRLRDGGPALTLAVWQVT
jgi:hypothetical protein